MKTGSGYMAANPSWRRMKLAFRGKKKWFGKAGCMTQTQISSLKDALIRADKDPSLLCDLEGCGPVAELEKEFARICGTRFALAVSSGTASIHTALLASGVGPGDEVIVSPYSWEQSVSPVLFIGATPVFADIDSRTLNMDPESALRRMSTRTKAILPVHLFGHPADMGRLEEIARMSGAVLISDAAHALGARLHGRPVGGWGDIACFSLGRGKLVSGGEGGLLVTDDESLFEKAVSLSQHIERQRRIKGPGQLIESFGLNYRIHTFAAILALSDLKDMERKLDHRKAVTDGFWEGIGEQEFIVPPDIIDGELPSPYGIPLSFEKANGREIFVMHLQEKGVPLRCGPVRVPLHIRLNKGALPHTKPDCSQQGEVCPMAEERCNKRELWALSALDTDGSSPEEAYGMGEMIRTEMRRLFLGQ